MHCGIHRTGGRKLGWRPPWHHQDRCGTLKLNAVNTYACVTNINQGTDEIGALGSINGSSGPIGVAITLNNVGDVLSPGNSPDVQSYTVAQSWNSFSYDWEVNDFDGITGFDISEWTINAANFTNAEGGVWSLAVGNEGNDLVLSYTAIPEPAAAILGGLGLLALLRRRRR